MTRSLTGRRLAVTALVLGAGAAVAGSRSSAGDGRIDVAQLSRAVAQEDDHVTALELAAWIKARKPHLRIVDLRAQGDFDSLHIPQAERIPIETIGQARFGADETIVLYSDGGAHSAQAWVFLKALGHNDVYFLRGGMYEWIQDVLGPTLPVDASDAERERFAKASELSRYFGGVPRTGVPRAGNAATVNQIRRRTC